MRDLLSLFGTRAVGCIDPVRANSGRLFGKKGGLFRLILPLMLGCSALPYYASAEPYTNDASTVLLDHFENATLGSAQGTAGFSNGPIPLSRCAYLPEGGFIMYSPSVSYTTSGTIEFWVKPSEWPCSIMCFNGSYRVTQPGGGYVMHVTLNANGTVHWYGGANLDGMTPVPTNQWTHVAVTWGTGTRIYVNGIEDAYVASNLNPSGGYLYLNSSWGRLGIGSVDEVRISRTARSAAELRAHYLENSKTYHRLDVTVQGSGAVTPSNGWYEAGTSVNLVASANPGWLFVGWSGGLVGGYTASNTAVVLNEDKHITATFSDDADSDGLVNTAESSLGTDPRNRDSDGDGFDDGFEVQHGYAPLVSDAALTDYIRAHTATFGLYPSNVVLEVAVGQALLRVSNGSARLNLQLQQKDNLTGPWTNAGSAIEWSLPVSSEKQFFRVRSGP